MWAVIVVAGVLAILLLAEYLSRYKGLHSELSRKLVHLLVGIFVAFWPFFMSWRQIQLLSLIFLVVVLVSIKAHLFRAIHAVERNSFGEVLFAIVIGLLAIITTEPWVFAASMLVLSVSDGLAAVFGLAFGASNSYKVFGQTKSVVGSLTFFFSAIAIMLVYSLATGLHIMPFTIVWVPLIATIVENLAVKGTDNLALPLFVAIALSSV